MKEEIIKLLENIKLNNEQGNENYNIYEEITKDFKYAIEKIKKADENLELYQEIKESVKKINEHETDFRKYRTLKSMSQRIIALL